MPLGCRTPGYFSPCFAYNMDWGAEGSPYSRVVCTNRNPELLPQVICKQTETLVLDFWKWRYINRGAVKTSRIGSGKETASCLDSINVAYMCFNSIHLYINTMGCFAGSPHCIALVSSFLPENKGEGRKSTRGKKQASVSCASCHLTEFFFLIKM